MAFNYPRFFAVNSLIVGLCYVVYTAALERHREKLYKSTTIFREAMEILKSHKGAVHFLGEPIEDGKLYAMNETKEDDKTIHQVKVAVSGSDGHGNLFFWVSRNNENSDAQLNRIELQIRNINKKLLVFDRDKSKDSNLVNQL